jgi:hypothetical protein
MKQSSIGPEALPWGLGPSGTRRHVTMSDPDKGRSRQGHIVQPNPTNQVGGGCLRRDPDEDLSDKGPLVMTRGRGPTMYSVISLEGSYPPRSWGS